MATLSSEFDLTFGSGIQPKTVYAGYLNKKGAVNKAWKKRWFVLYDNRKLTYYTSQMDVVNNKAPINYIDLSKVTAVRVVNKTVNKPKRRKQQTFSMSSSKASSVGNIFLRNNKNNKHLIHYHSKDSIEFVDMQFSNQFSFELVSPKRVYTLCCDHAASFNEWIDNLESTVFGKKLYKGWMMKQGEVRKTWKKRWFIIFNTKEMRYYEDDKRLKPKGSIFLTDLLTMKLIPDGIKYDEANILELHTPNRIWVLSAYNKQNRQLWWDRIASISPNCHQLTPIYEDHLFKYDATTNSWIYRYFALDTKSLMQFDKIEDCERYKSCTYFDDDIYNGEFRKYVQLTIPLTKQPVIKRIGRLNEEFNKFNNKNNVFKIETNMECFYFTSDHDVQIDRWFTAFQKLKKLRLERKDSQKTQLLKQTNSMFNHPLNEISNEEAVESSDTDILTEEDEIDEYKENDNTKHRMIASRPDMNIVSALISMGFMSDNACKRAALAVNNSSTEMAALWLFDNMENPEVLQPLYYTDDEDIK